MTPASVGGATTSRLRGFAHPDACAREARGVVSSESQASRPGPLPASAEVPTNPAGFEQRRNRSSEAPAGANFRDARRRPLSAFFGYFFRAGKKLPGARACEAGRPERLRLVESADACGVAAPARNRVLDEPPLDLAKPQKTKAPPEPGRGLRRLACRTLTRRRAYTQPPPSRYGPGRRGSGSSHRLGPARRRCCRS